MFHNLCEVNNLNSACLNMAVVHTQNILGNRHELDMIAIPSTVVDILKMAVMLHPYALYDI